MQMGFSVGQSTRCLVERPQSQATGKARISTKDDSHMVPCSRMEESDYKNVKVRAFVEDKE